MRRRPRPRRRRRRRYRVGPVWHPPGLRPEGGDDLGKVDRGADAGLGVAHDAHGVDGPVGGVTPVTSRAMRSSGNGEAQLDVERGVAVDDHPPTGGTAGPRPARARSCSTSWRGRPGTVHRLACPRRSSAARRRCRPRWCRRRSRSCGRRSPPHRWPRPSRAACRSPRPATAAMGPKLCAPCAHRAVAEAGRVGAEAHELEQQRRASRASTDRRTRRSAGGRVAAGSTSARWARPRR